MPEALPVHQSLQRLLPYKDDLAFLEARRIFPTIFKGFAPQLPIMILLKHHTSQDHLPFCMHPEDQLSRATTEQLELKIY